MQFGSAPRGRDFSLSGSPALRVPIGSWPTWVEDWNPNVHFSTQNGTRKSISPVFSPPNLSLSGGPTS